MGIILTCGGFQFSARYEIAFLLYIQLSPRCRRVVCSVSFWSLLREASFVSVFLGGGVCHQLVGGVLFGFLKSATLSAAFRGMFIIGETKPKPENMVWRLFMSLRLTAPIRGALSM